MQRIRIGFHGVPSAGKTVLQVMYYGCRDLGEGGIVFTDGPTIRYLRPRWEEVCGGKTPTANPMGKPDRLLWQVETRGGAWEVEAMDFAGALIEPGTDGEVAAVLANQVQDFLAGCDGMFLLVDSSDPNPRQLDALALLLEQLRRRSPTENGGRQRPVALLLTKFDRLGPLDGDWAANQLRAVQCLRGHPIFKQIHQLLNRRQEGAWRFQVFPVSAFGTNCRDGAAPPPGQLKPYNLYEPLQWMVTEVDQELRRSKSVRHRRRTKIGIASLVTFVALLAGAFTFGCWRAAVRVADVERFCREHPGASDAPRRIEARQEFLDSPWAWGLLTRAAVRADLARKAHDDRLALFASRYEQETAASASRESAGAAGADYESWDALLASFTDVPDAPDRDQAGRRREFARSRWDSLAWSRATAADTAYVTDYEAARNLYRQWQRVPGTDPVRRARAVESIGRLEGAWDRLQYEKAYEGAKGACTWEQFDAAVAAARAYDASDRGVKRMTAPVQRLLQWADAIRGGRVVWNVRVSSATIPYASPLRDTFDFHNADVSFTLALNSLISDTRHRFVEHTRIADNYELGNYPVAWGRPLRVRATLRAYSQSGATAAGEVDFTPAFDGTNTSVSTAVPLRDGKGAETSAVLVWRCDGLAAPTLPHYGD